MPHTFHAEYSTASQQNQVPWAALEGGVLMQQEIGHFESCNSVAHRITLTGTGFSDTHTFQTCMGGSEGKHAVGEGPCNPNTGVCGVARTEGTSVVHDAVTADGLAPSQAPSRACPARRARDRPGGIRPRHPPGTQRDITDANTPAGGPAMTR